MTQCSAGTGEAQGFRVDYFRGTFHAPADGGSPHEFLRCLLERRTGLRFVECRRGRYGYRRRLDAVQADVSILYDHPQGPWVSLDVPGASMDVVGVQNLTEITEAAARRGCRVKATRVDLALDTEAVTPAEVYARLQGAGAYFRGCRESVTWYDHPWEKADNGRVGCSGVTCGSRESGRYLRVYDRHGPTRIELEMKEAWAEAVWQRICAGKTDGLEGLILDYLDFPKWQAWRKAFAGVPALALGVFRGVVEAARDVVERKKAWLMRQVARVAALVDAYEWAQGRCFLEGLLEQGQDRLELEDVELVKAALDLKGDRSIGISRAAACPF